MEKRRPSFIRTQTNLSYASDVDFKEFEKNKDSLKGKFADFCSGTSFTPVAHIYRAGPVWKKFAWVIVSFTLFGYMAYQCGTLINTYLSYPSEVNIKLEFSPQLEFPSVTICNLNPIKWKKLQASPYGELFDDLIDDGSDDPMYQSFRRQHFPSSESEESLEYYGPPQPDYPGDPIGEFDGEYPGGMATEVNEPDMPMPTAPKPPPSSPKPPPRTPTNPPSSSATNPPFPKPTNPSASPPPTDVRRRKRRSTLEADGSLTTVNHRRTRRETTNTTSLTSMAENITALLSNSTYNQWEYLDEIMEEEFYNTMSSQHQAVDIISQIVAKMDVEIVKSMGHKKKDFIMSCKWQGYPCSPKNFTSFVNYKYGNCFTFNALVNVSENKAGLRTNNPGPLYGLELELFIEQDEYTPAVSQEAGARVVIHSRGKIPFPEDEGFTISPGFLTSVGMRKTSITRLPDPHGNCSNTFEEIESLYDDENTLYSKQACTKSCYQQKIIDRCECGLTSYPIPYNVSVCQPEQLPCVVSVEDEFKKDSLGCDMACPLPCSDEAFSLTISTAVWPSIGYQRNFETKMMRSSTKLMRSVMKGQSVEDTAKLEIFYQELNFQKIEQKKSYEFQNVVSDLGGQLGLWLGVSVLALGEILDFFISVAQYGFFKLRSKRPVGRGTTPIYPYRPPQD